MLSIIIGILSLIDIQIPKVWTYIIILDPSIVLLWRVLIQIVHWIFLFDYDEVLTITDFAMGYRGTLGWLFFGGVGNSGGG